RPRPAARRPAACGRSRSPCRCPIVWPRPLLEPHAVRVAVTVVALMDVTVTGRDAGLAHDDHAGRAPVDAEPAPRADILVDDEDHVIVGVEPGLGGVERVLDRLGGEHPDALPRADVD